ncbi:hypothetical protein BGZ83_006885 [Gryganskiella cystojenkinii]|nr:hypothetical protein BGZ83_006885 [Gryganskiella cystojenkinii]
MSTYQTDLLFVQENRLPIVFTTLSSHGLHVAHEDDDDDLVNTPPDTPIPDQIQFRTHTVQPIQEEEGHHEDEEGEHERHSYRIRSSQHQHNIDKFSRLSLVTPPGSMDSSCDEGPGSSDIILSHHAGKPLVPLDIFSAQRHHHEESEGQGRRDEYDENLLNKSSPTTTTAFELRQQAVRTLPENFLRCVGLNTDLEVGHQPWILKIIKILFYHDEVKEAAISAGRGPNHNAPRFFSFTATSECVSMITDTYILEEFEEHELFMDMNTCPLRLIQLDLHRFGLDKFGIIHSVARPLTEAGIELLYLSTFSTANILVAEHRLSDAEQILSGSGTSTPRSNDDNSDCGEVGEDGDDEG